MTDLRARQGALRIHTRARPLPSLLLREWPAEALSGVARSFLQDVDLGPPAAAGVAAPIDSDAAATGSGRGEGWGGLEGVVQCCVAIHRSVEERSRRYYEELRR